MYYCGIDIAKHKATAIDETGKALLDSISFPYIPPEARS